MLQKTTPLLLCVTILLSVFAGCTNIESQKKITDDTNIITNPPGTSPKTTDDIKFPNSVVEFLENSIQHIINDAEATGDVYFASPLKLYSIWHVDDDRNDGFFMHYHESIEYFEEENNLQIFAIWTDVILKDFKFITIETDLIIDELGYVWGWENERPGEVLYQMDEFVPEKPFVVKTYINEHGPPRRGVSYTDENGIIIYRSIGHSGLFGFGFST